MSYNNARLFLSWLLALLAISYFCTYDRAACAFHHHATRVISRPTRVAKNVAAKGWMKAKRNHRAHPATFVASANRQEGLSFLSALRSASTADNDNTNAMMDVSSSVKILILPGFGNDESDYFLQQAPEGSLVQSLLNRGWRADQIHVLPVRRSDWLQVFVRGCLDWKFWCNDAAPTRPAFDWYLQRVAQQIQNMTTTTTNNNDNVDDCQVVLLCHSAGGWLGRAALGWKGTTSKTNDVLTQEQKEDAYFFPLDRVLGMVTLGAPHLPPPPTVMDMTRGALRITNECFPGAYRHQTNNDGNTAERNDLFYITVVGDAVQGVFQERQGFWEPTTVTGFAYESYQAVCGNGTATGDGVVPMCAAHLDGAIQLDLPNVFHSINRPDQWYGSNDLLDLWHNVMMQEISKRTRPRPPPVKKQAGNVNSVEEKSAR